MSLDAAQNFRRQFKNNPRKVLKLRVWGNNIPTNTRTKDKDSRRPSCFDITFLVSLKIGILHLLE